MAGVLASSVVTVVAVVVVLLWLEFAFQYLMSVALIAGIINWVMIMITELRFRRRIGASGAAQLGFPLPGRRAAAVFVLAVLGLVVVLMAASSSYRTAVVIGRL